MKNKNKVIPMVIAAAALIILIALIILGTRLIQRYIPSNEPQDMQEYYHLTAENDMAMVVDEELLEVNAKYIDGTVYVDYETVHDRFNERFYWDTNENVLLYTLPDKLITVPAGSNTYQLDKENVTAAYTIVRNDSNVMYMALDFVEQYTNMTHVVYENPNRVVITSKWEEIETASAKKETELRRKGGIKSPILKELTKEEKLIVLEPGEDWTKVATEDGMIGYLKSKFLGSSEKTVRSHEFEEPQFTHIKREGTIQMAWHQVTNQEGNARVANVLQNTKGINVLSPTWFHLKDDQGNINSLASQDYVNYCHQNNIEVWALVSNLEGTSIETSTHVLTHTSIRQNLVNQIISAAIQYDLDGINLDFESLSGEVGDGYIQFVRELSLKCANNNIVLSVDNYVPSNYTAFYNRDEQALFADYIVVMGYDEHYAGSEEEGSVASIGFVRDGVANTLLEVPADQVILACPFYTRIWALTPKENPGEDEYPFEVTSEAVGMDTAQKRLEVNGATASWSEEAGQYYAEYVNEGVTYRVWLEDASSMELRLETMKSSNLAGISFWKLGFENNSIWDTIIKYTNN